MVNILTDRMKTAKLTKTQRRIAEFFLQNQERIGSMSSLDVAGEIGVSDASIIRFARALGFEGYADLKEQIYQMLVKNAYGEMTLSQRLSRNREQYGKEDMRVQFQQLMVQNMESVFRDNKPEDFEHIADLLATCNHKLVVGLRGCKGVAVGFGRLLSFMLPKVHILIDGECTTINQLQDVGPDDVLVMLAYSRLYKIDVTYMELAKARGAHICLLTNDITSPLCAYAEAVLVMSTFNLSFFHATLGLDFVAEYLLCLVSRRVDYKARLDERDDLTLDQRP